MYWNIAHFFLKALETHSLCKNKYQEIPDNWRQSSYSQTSTTSKSSYPSIAKNWKEQRDSSLIVWQKLWQKCIVRWLTDWWNLSRRKSTNSPSNLQNKMNGRNKTIQAKRALNGTTVPNDLIDKKSCSLMINFLRTGDVYVCIQFRSNQSWLIYASLWLRLYGIRYYIAHSSVTLLAVLSAHSRFSSTFTFNSSVPFPAVM